MSVVGARDRGSPILLGSIRSSTAGEEPGRGGRVGTKERRPRRTPVVRLEGKRDWVDPIQLLLLRFPSGPKTGIGRVLEHEFRSFAI